MPLLHARLYIDETGDFSPRGDDMRMVGGLLAIGDHTVEGSLERIHNDIGVALQWPVRLHAREMVELGCVLRWHAAGGAAQRALLDPAEAIALDAAIAALPQAPPHQTSRTWSTISKVRATDPHRGVLLQVGRKLLRRSQVLLRNGFQSWCNSANMAFIIAGHVDERIPGGAQAYDTAFEKALATASRVAKKAGASHIDVEIAEPGVQTPSEIQRCARKVPGVANVNIVKYDSGSQGLWLADSLLAWTRPPPRAVSGSALDPHVGVRRCLRVSSSTKTSRPSVLECPFDYFADAIADTELAL